MLDRIPGAGLSATTIRELNGAEQPAHDPAKIKKAATQFEALLIGQLVKSMRESGSEGWLGTGDDQTGGMMMEIAEEQLAQSMAAQGGLGLASLAVQGMDKDPGKAAAATPAKTAPFGTSPKR